MKWNYSTWRSKSSEGSSSCVQTPDCYFCMGDNWEDRTRLFSVMHSDRIRRNVNKLRCKKFHLNIRPKPFWGGIEDWYRFPLEVVLSLSLEILKAEQYMSLNNLL